MARKKSKKGRRSSRRSYKRGGAGDSQYYNASNYSTVDYKPVEHSSNIAIQGIIVVVVFAIIAVVITETALGGTIRDSFNAILAPPVETTMPATEEPGMSKGAQVAIVIVSGVMIMLLVWQTVLFFTNREKSIFNGLYKAIAGMIPGESDFAADARKSMADVDALTQAEILSTESYVHENIDPSQVETFITEAEAAKGQGSQAYLAFLRRKQEEIDGK
jgi:hypothetical protein